MSSESPEQKTIKLDKHEECESAKVKDSSTVAANGTPATPFKFSPEPTLDQM